MMLRSFLRRAGTLAGIALSSAAPAPADTPVTAEALAGRWGSPPISATPMPAGSSKWRGRIAASPTRSRAAGRAA